MTNCTGDVLGIQLRTGAGRKFAIKGSHDGLFVSVGLDRPNLLLIAEGPTDTAALLDLRFDAIGRPSCRGGTALLVNLIRHRRPDEVVIVADNDAPKSDGTRPGLDGALTLAPKLLPRCRRLRVVTPPIGIKDARHWVQVGATYQAILDAILDAAYHRLAVRASISTPVRGRRRHAR